MSGERAIVAVRSLRPLSLLESMSNQEPTAFSVPSAPNADSIRVIVVGNPQAVDNFIATQHQLGFAEVLAWSPPLPTPHPQQVMRILTKRLAISH
jgi:hypothetical protein